jgi:X-X-X-Leu-X-X-Gly heptad repeat protein
MTTSAQRVAGRQDGNYRAPVVAKAQGGAIPRWNPPASMDNGLNDATAGAPQVTEGSGQ